MSTTNQRCIYQRFGPGFGDIINGLCKAINQTLNRGESVIYVSTLGKPHIAPFRVRVCKEFFYELNIPKHLKLKFVDEPGNMDHLGGFADTKNYFWKTKIQWEYNEKSNLICYCLKSGSERIQSKYFSREERNIIRRILNHSSFSLKVLNGNRTIKEDLYFLSKSICFIGIEGGAAHLATRVGTPAFCKYWKYNLQKDLKYVFCAEKYNPRVSYFYHYSDIERFLEFLEQDKSICQKLLV